MGKDEDDENEKNIYFSKNDNIKLRKYQRYYIAYA